MWNKLSMKDRAEYIKLGVANGITSLDEIRNIYNKYAKGGSLEDPEKEWKALNNINFEAIPDTTFTRDKTGVGDIEYFNPRYPDIRYPNGYYREHPRPGKNVILYNPNNNDEQDVRLDALHIMPEDATYNALNILYRNAARNSDVSYNARMRYNEDVERFGKDAVDSYEQYFNNEADGLLRNMFIEGSPEYIKSRHYYPDKKQLREWNKPLLPYIDAIQNYLETGKRPPYILPEVVVTPNGNKYAEGGLKDSWKPWYWFTPEYEGDSLKEALFKAYDDGREGSNIIYKGSAYKVALSEKDLQEYNIRKQHELNRAITDEQVVNSYIDNVLYTMENPKNKGFINGKYYPYSDKSADSKTGSDYNLGPGINKYSEIGGNLIYDGSRGYTKKELDAIVREDLLLKMADIRQDLSDMYGEDADTMSLGNRMILLDIAHNVRPRGKKRANMPKGWPSLVKGMMSGDSSEARENTNSGSTRRQNMRNDLLWQNVVDENTVKNR